MLGLGGLHGTMHEAVEQFGEGVDAFVALAACLGGSPELGDEGGPGKGRTLLSSTSRMGRPVSKLAGTPARMLRMAFIPPAPCRKTVHFHDRGTTHRETLHRILMFPQHLAISIRNY